MWRPRSHTIAGTVASTDGERDAVSAQGPPHPFFDSLQFPWHRREGVALHRALYSAIPHPARLNVHYRQACDGLPPLPREAPDVVWAAALDNLSAGKCLQRFCELLVADDTVAAIHPAITAVQDARYSRQDAIAMVRSAIGDEHPADLDLSDMERLLMNFFAQQGISRRALELVPILLDEAVQYYSCFISYSSQDQVFAARLHSDLQRQGVSCWFAPHDMTGGKKIHEQIDEEIRIHDRLLLILSEASMTSRWVKTEIANALDKEQRTRKRVLFPVSLVPFDRVREWKNFNADIGIDAAREIREYYIPDFTDWDKDPAAYESAFDKLLAGLRAVG